MHIACSINKKYIKYCSVMLQSIINHTIKKELFIHVLHNDLTIKDEIFLKDIFKGYPFLSFNFYKIEREKFSIFPVVADHLTVETLFRLFLAELLPNNIEKVIYIDSDIVVKEDLLNVWNIDIGKYPLAAVPNLEGVMYRVLGLKEKNDYFNAGFIVINLNKWRTEKYLEKFIKFTEGNREKIIFGDQDILNGVLRGDWLRLHPKWNVQNSIYSFKEDFLEYYSEECYETVSNYPAIIHYSSKLKPWNILNYQIKSEEYFHILKKNGDMGGKMIVYMRK